jgi:hypothetical protein
MFSDDAIRLLHSDLTSSEVARRLGCSKQNVWHARRVRGISTKPRPRKVKSRCSWCRKVVRVWPARLKRTGRVYCDKRCFKAKVGTAEFQRRRVAALRRGSTD